jgi:hypothetical protein
MSEVKKPPRLHRQGLLFSSRKRKRSPSPSPANESTIPHNPQFPEKKTIKTSILILSDTHGHSALQSLLPENLHLDAVIHCGDLSQCGEIEDYKRTLDLLKAIPASIRFVIPGNHDLSLDPAFPTHSSPTFTTTERQDLYAQALKLWTSPSAKEARIILLDPGFQTFALSNGANLHIYTTPYTPFPPTVSTSEWAFGHPSSHDIYNPLGSGIWYSTPSGTPQTLIPDEKRGVIDVLISHGPPRYRLDRTEEGENVGCKNIWRAVRRCRPRVHAFGHVHAGYGADVVRWREEGKESLPRDDDIDDGIEEVKKVDGRMVEGGVRLIEAKGARKGEETLFVNAALKGDEVLERAPWVVEIELARAKVN